MKRIDYIIISLLFLSLLGGFYLIHYLFTNVANECVASPLTFGAGQLEKAYGYEVQGYGIIKVPLGYEVPEFTFNSSNLTIS